MQIETTKFGTIEYDQEQVMTIDILGFSDYTSWIFIDEERATPFRMLQSLNNPELAFVTVDPLNVRPDYCFMTTPDELKEIGATKTDNLLVMSIVQMDKNIQDVTLNLQGPIVINGENGKGMQVILKDSEYTTRERLLTGD